MAKKGKDEVWDTIIIGSGVTGYAAAMYNGRFLLKTLVIGDLPGGVITTTNEVWNYPGFNFITGLELANKLEEHAKEYKDVTIKMGKASKIEKLSNGGFRVYVNDEHYLAKTIIFATGTKAKELGVPGEKEFFNMGVHTCALCDGAFYKDKVIGVVGGSDSAAKEALLLTTWGKKVYIIYRGDKIHPEPVNGERVKKNKKIEIINNTNVTEIKGDKKVTGIVLDKAFNGKKELGLDAVFIEIGHIPLSQLAKDLGVDLNEKGEIKIDRESKTNVEGVYAAGDVVDTIFKQAITGVGEGVTASYSAYQYITNTTIDVYDTYEDEKSD